jgi:SAM-dependent methyltransferase
VDSHAWDARYAASERVWSVEPNQFVAAALADLPPGRAVDLAAGEGRNAIWLASLGWEVTAVDFSQVAMDRGRRVAGDLPVTWVCSDVLAWTPTRPLDLALLAYLQIPAVERRTAVRLAFDSLGVGGTLFLVAHDSTNLAEGTGGPQDPTVLMTAEDVLADLADRSLEVLTAGRVERQVTRSDGASRTAYDTLVRLVRRA